MSHGAKPAVALLFGLAVLLSAGIAGACPAHTTHSAEAPASQSTASAPTGGTRG